MFNDYQARVANWAVAVFGREVARNQKIRNYRFIEEALELVQAGGCTKEQVLSLVDYVFARPVGEVKQEVGGVAVTLAALCAAYDIDMGDAAWTEQSRCEQPEVMEKIRLKQITKPHPDDVLPGAV